MIQESLVIANITLLGAFVVSMGLRWAFFWKIMRKQTFAILVDKDLNTKAVKRVDTRKKFFSYDGNSYNVGVPYLKVGNKKYLLYLIGTPDHLDIRQDTHASMPADAYEAILKSEMIKKINRGEGLFGSWDIKKVAIVAAVVLAAYFVFTGGLV